MSAEPLSRIALVEDDPDIPQVTQTLLEDCAELHHAASIAEAKQMLDKNCYELVLLDLSMNDGFGAGLIDDIKDRCPIVILSAQEASREVSARVEAALTKSRTSNEQLFNTIKRALRRRRRNHA